MLLAVGKDLEISKFFDILSVMASDRNKIHERNKGKLGSFKHSDGWGIAYLEENRFQLFHSIKPVYEDFFPNEIRERKTDFVIIHARKQGKGKVCLENTHPFFLNSEDKEWVFCHNGTIIDDILNEGKFQPKGNTDSERLFCSWLNRLKKGESIEKIIDNASTETITPKENIFDICIKSIAISLNPT